MNNSSGIRDNNDPITLRCRKIKLQRKILRIRLGIIIASLSPVMIIALPLSWILERFMDWKDGQYQKIENLRVDLVYLAQHGMTHDEYYKDDNNVVDEDYNRQWQTED